MKPPAPPRVESIEFCWSDPPTELSPRCIYWVKRIRDGWRANTRIRTQGYYGAAAYFGVWLWEYFQVIERALDGEEGGATDKEDIPIRNALLEKAGLEPMPAVWTEWHRHRWAERAKFQASRRYG